jgi:hypothetical protein
MATIIFLILAIACEVFLVFAFVHFRSEDRARGGATPQPPATRMVVVRPRRAEAARTPPVLQGTQIRAVTRPPNRNQTVKKPAQRKDIAMLDLIFVAATVFFVVVAIAYVRACERLR